VISLTRPSLVPLDDEEYNADNMNQINPTFVEGSEDIMGAEVCVCGAEGCESCMGAESFGAKKRKCILCKKSKEIVGDGGFETFEGKKMKGAVCSTCEDEFVNVAYEDYDLPNTQYVSAESDGQQLENLSIKTDKRLRFVLFGFTALLTISAPIVSFFYPSAWTFILAAALAFTIGTNLLISVVTVRVEDKADLMEARMVELLGSLNTAAFRLEEFHGQLDVINIPAVKELVENVREEFAPGLNSFDDVDIGAISYEVRRWTAFVDTLDMDKVGNYLKHIRKAEHKDKPVMVVHEADPDYDVYWNDADISEPDPLISILSKNRADDVDFLSRIIG
jgi:hypothetical protein